MSKDKVQCQFYDNAHRYLHAVWAQVRSIILYWLKLKVSRRTAREISAHNVESYLYHMTFFE